MPRSRSVPLRAPLRATALLAALLPPLAAQQERDHFVLGKECALCHSLAAGASAMRTPLGDDASPHGLWQATLMANSFHDPYFRAALERESQADAAVQELCLRCHAPMAHHTAIEKGGAPPRLADAMASPLAKDGVSCTFCHQIADAGLGQEATFDGRPVLANERRIFGPFPDPAEGPMRMHVGYTPTQGMHVRKAGLCGTCHTLHTEHHGGRFPEQTPYLEWRNSEFSDEDGRHDTSRTCQECHMARTGSTRIARNPMGRDFLIPVRDGFAAHGFYGGNAFVLDLLQGHRDELGVTATAESLARAAAATRAQLAEQTARLMIPRLTRTGDTLAFAVAIENLAGHKFPTGYPSRRAWLHVQVRAGRDVLFESGGFDKAGRIAGLADELDMPHVVKVTTREQVPIYEMVADDAAGKPTTALVQMARKRKDNRLLPRGHRLDGPHAADTAPIGTDGDADFVAGGDTVAYEVALPKGQAGRLQVVVWLHYQTIPPAWADAVRTGDGEAAQRFVRLYDGADKTPETVAIATRLLEP